MQIGLCLHCGSERFELEQQDKGFKTWRCLQCHKSFTIGRNGDRWNLYSGGNLVSEDMTDISGRLGMYNTGELITLFEASSETRDASYGGPQPPQPEDDFHPPHVTSESVDQEAYWRSIAEQGGSVPRRYAYLLPEEGREQRAVIPGSIPAPKHLLDGVITDANAYLSEIPSCVRLLAKSIGINVAQLDGSMDSAELVDAAIRLNPKLWLTGERLRCAIAYAGEMISSRVGGAWVAHYNAADDQWEPLIRDEHGILYNPWLDLYKGILEGNGWALTSTVNLEVSRSPEQRTDRLP